MTFPSESLATLACALKSRAVGLSAHNTVSLSLSYWSHYRACLTIILQRYCEDASDHDLARAEHHEAFQKLGNPPADGNRRLTDEEESLVRRFHDRTRPLQLDIESFYLFSKILLDRMADTLCLCLAFPTSRTGSSYSKLATSFEAHCQANELEIVPSDLAETIKSLRTRIIDYRNEHIEHTGAPFMQIFAKSDGRLVLMPMAGHLMIGRKPSAGYRFSEPLDDLVNELDRFVEAIMAFLTANLGRVKIQE